MPPPTPGLTQDEIVAFIRTNATNLQIAWVLLALTAGIRVAVVRTHRRADATDEASARVLAYAYLAVLAVAALPGCLFCGLMFALAAFRPDRDPQIVALLYDMGLLSFVGSLGCFVTQYLVFAIAIFLDKRAIFPKWLAYMSMWGWSPNWSRCRSGSSEAARTPGTVRSASSWARSSSSSGRSVSSSACTRPSSTSRSKRSWPMTTQPGRPALTRRTPMPGDADIWVFVIGDMLIFCGVFCRVHVHRPRQEPRALPAVAAAAQQRTGRHQHADPADELAVRRVERSGRAGGRRSASRRGFWRWAAPAASRSC